MNFMFLSINNINIPRKRFDIIPAGVIPNVEMYLVGPQCRLTYNGEEMTSIVDNSSFKDDVGKCDWHAMMRKPLIAIWSKTEDNEKNFNSKEDADKYYTYKEMFFSDIVQLLMLAIWMVKDCSVYSNLFYLCNTDNGYSVKGRRNMEFSNSFGKTSVISLDEMEMKDVLEELPIILDVYYKALKNNSDSLCDVSYSQGTVVCDVESFLQIKGGSFYRIIILLQLSRKSGFLPAKISMYCAVLECLFAIEKNHKSNISKMTALYIANSCDEIEIIKEVIKMSYGVRSDFVHGDVNLLFSQKEQLAELSEKMDDYVRRAVKKAFRDEKMNYENTNDDKNRVRKYFAKSFCGDY